MEEEQKYHPLSYTEFVELKNQIDRIKDVVPESVAPYFWDMYNRIRAVNQPRPCMCQSSAGLWIGCVNFLREWLGSKLN
jgi:hypothetical protein